jgi:hypothetical protein
MELRAYVVQAYAERTGWNRIFLSLLQKLFLGRKRATLPVQLEWKGGANHVPGIVRGSADLAAANEAYLQARGDCGRTPPHNRRRWVVKIVSLSLMSLSVGRGASFRGVLRKSSTGR